MQQRASFVHQPAVVTDLTDWGEQPDSIAGRSKSSGILLDKRYDGKQESGLWQCTPGKWRLSIPSDEFCYFLSGSATYEGDDGSVVEIKAPMAVMFPAGWSGVCTVFETIRNTYFLVAPRTDLERPEATAASPVVKARPLAETEVADWGNIDTMIEGVSKMSGYLFYKGDEGQSECGVWNCTPGYWNCHVTRDEYCHFLEGRCTYTSEDGDIIEVTPDTVAFFPQDWKGTCKVHETVRKVYMIR